MRRFGDEEGVIAELHKGAAGGLPYLCMRTDVRCRECGQVFDGALVDGRFDGVCPRCLARFALKTEVGAPDEGPLPLPVGATFRGIEIVGVLGRGGMGVVYKARQTELGRDVALKVLAPDLAHDPEFVERFNREARALATLSHPNIVSVHEFGREGDLCFLAMEFVDGRSLRDIMNEGRLPVDRALRILPQICEALEHAHAHGVVHRDIKPENVLVDRAGRVKIADFGLAKVRAAKLATLTRTDVAMGTPQYMAPEQYDRMKDVDGRADIYSLGVMFYEMLTGDVPAGHFDPPSKKAKVDARLDPVVLKAMAREPERRYQRAAHVKTDVEAVRERPAPEEPPGDGLTLEAREAIARAFTEARVHGAEFTGTEHILLGVLSVAGDGEAVLAKLGATAARVRAELENVMRPAPPNAAAPPMTPAARRAIAEARAGAATEAGTQHLVLALVRLREGIAFEVLRRIGVAEEALARAVAQQPCTERSGARRPGAGLATGAIVLALAAYGILLALVWAGFDPSADPWQETLRPGAAIIVPYVLVILAAIAAGGVALVRCRAGTGGGLGRATFAIVWGAYLASTIVTDTFYHMAIDIPAIGLSVAVLVVAHGVERRAGGRLSRLAPVGFGLCVAGLYAGQLCMLADAQGHLALTCATAAVAGGCCVAAVVLSLAALAIIRMSTGALNGRLYALTPLLLSSFVIPLAAMAIYVSETRPPPAVRPLGPGETRGDLVGPNLEWIALSPAELPPGVVYARDDVTDAGEPLSTRGQMNVLMVLVTLKLGPVGDLGVSVTELQGMSIATAGPGSVGIAILQLKSAARGGDVAATIRSNQKDAIVIAAGGFVGVVTGDRLKPAAARTADAVAAVLRRKLERVSER